MSVFAIKLLALISMATDHLAWVLYLDGKISYEVCVPLRAVGRLAFPLYCYLLVNGFRHTSNRRRYLSRLMLLAVLSQLPYSLAFTQSNYSAAPGGALSLSFTYSLPLCLAIVLLSALAWLVFVSPGRPAVYIALLTAMGMMELSAGSVILLSPVKLNVFYTLSFGLAAMAVLDDLLHQDLPAWKALGRAALLICLIILLLPHADYGYNGLWLILLLCLCRDRRIFQLAALAVMSFVLYRANEPIYIWFSLLTLLPAALYNGKLGRPMKWGFYLFYPVHLLILGIAAVIL